MLYRTLLFAGALAVPGCRSCHSTPGDPQSAATHAKTSPVQHAPDMAGFTIEPTKEGKAVIRFDHADLARVEYVFFGPDWKWGGLRIEPGTAEGGRLPFSMEAPPLGLKIEGHVEPGEPGELVFTYAIEATKRVDGVEGGGLEFRLRQHPKLRKEGAEKPWLLAQNGGFVWGLGQGRELAVRFEGDLERVYFERNRPDLIRAFFVGQVIEPGKRKITMRIRLPEGGTVIPSLEARYGSLDPQTWHEQTLAWDRWPVDLRVLNDGDRPAGQHGRVAANGSALVFEDGTSARFWGTNVAARTLYTGDHDQVCNQAKRLASFGFNLVRLHHHDSGWLRPNVFDNPGRSTRSVRGGALEAIDWWVKCLQDEGIYVWIDLHVGRSFASGDDVEGLAELRGRKGEGKAFNYVNEDIEVRMQEFARQYFDRENQYTKRRYPDDPGVVAVLITNENDLPHHGGKFLVAKSGNTVHARKYRDRATAFARQSNLPVQEMLDPRRPAARIALADLQARFSERSTKQLRAMGYRGLVATTNFWGKPPFFVLPPLTVGDIIDVHAYGDAEFLSAHPLHEPNFAAWIASGQVAGMPLTVSEWNVAHPARDRFAAPLYVASLAALQGWNAPMLYAYAQTPIEPPRKPGQWTAAHDPGLMAMMPAAAVLYRQGHVRAAEHTYRLQLDRKAVYGDYNGAQKSATIRTLYEQSRLEIALPDIPELPWDTPPKAATAAEVVTDFDRSFLAADATRVESDTRELMRDWGQGIHTIDTARTQAAQGWIGGRTVTLGDTEIAVQTPKAAVAVSSLDGRPIAKSERMLVTVVAQVQTQREDALPFLSEPVRGTLSIRSEAKTLQLRPLLDAAGSRADATAVLGRREGSRFVFELAGDLPTHWFMLEPAG
jgi:hypothetical protein